MEQTQNQQPPRVAILGGGYAGIYTALGLQHTASVRALSQVNLLTMAAADFTALANSSTRFGELLAGVMRQRQADTDNTDSHDSP